VPPPATYVCVFGRIELGAWDVTVDLRHQPPTPRFDGAALCYCRHRRRPTTLDVPWAAT
jgi:hypothetical protein